MISKASKKITYKPYEQMLHPGQRVQIDIKVVPQLHRRSRPEAVPIHRDRRIFPLLRSRAYPGQIMYSSAEFLHKVVKHFARKGVKVERVQTDKGVEFTKRFSNSKWDLPTMFEATAVELGIRHKLIRPYMPRHNGKVERSHREDQKHFYDTHRFYSLADFGGQRAAHQSRSNSRPMCPLR